MALLKVLTDDHPTLRQKSAPITTITDEIKQLAMDMVETMHTYHGVGLSAPQVGVLKRLIVLEKRPNPRYPEEAHFPLYIVINPEITPLSRQKAEGEEGCLSVPGWYGPVTRHCRIKVTGLDLQGKKIKLTVDDFAARVFQHEVDHLNGVLFTDYIDDPTLLRYVDLSEQTSEM